MEIQKSTDLCRRGCSGRAGGDISESAVTTGSRPIQTIADSSCKMDRQGPCHSPSPGCVNWRPFIRTQWSHASWRSSCATGGASVSASNAAAQRVVKTRDRARPSRWHVLNGPPARGSHPNICCARRHLDPQTYANFVMRFHTASAENGRGHSTLAAELT
jgi:hypothetical protein